MIAGTITLEDHSIHFTRGPRTFTLTAYDALKGQQGETKAIDEEMGALLAIAVGSDEIPGAEKFYDLAEGVCARLGIRLIP